ncbi:MAG: GIY-YIG nuclease family protein [Muribaculaceae bacterium]|nr:GIY-YIG nuclease family protein [Muribaculaceae bacterium]MDE7369308.1 GIY-YIG nuclease family protein [Muribaculaceae bacterium]
MKIDQTKIDAFKQESGAITTIQEILRGRDADFDAAKNVRLVRHADNRKVKIIKGEEVHGSLYTLYRYQKDTFLQYQKEQNKKRFENVEYMVAFIGEKGTTARFVGVYKVGNRVPSPYIEDDIICDMDIVEAFEPFTHRIVIDWGKSTVSWCQDYENQFKSVIRIDEGFEDGDGIPRFTSYADTVLSFGQLEAVINSNYDNPWQTALRSVNCIYVISDLNNGKHYVGSTYGENGIWGRWETYARTNGHGDNKALKELLNIDPNYARKNFQWSILEVLPLNITDDQAVDRENLYKQKLMSRHKATGYNEN